MSDARTLNLSSLVSKKTRRAKERLLQNFGKADRTTDELFEAHQLSFVRQQNVAMNFHKQVKHYIHCMRELHLASRGLNECLLEMHEKDWPKHESFDNISYDMVQINEDLEEKLKESVLVPLEQYLGQFTEMRDKIAKRGRKLVDYDSQRHSFETLQQNSAGKQQPDEAKLAEQREQLEEARRVYENLNQELHEELPELYYNRLTFVATVFQRFFSSHHTYHNDGVAVYKSLLESVDHLAKAIERGSFEPTTTTTVTTTTKSRAIEHQSPSNNQVTSTSVSSELKESTKNDPKVIESENRHAGEATALSATRQEEPPAVASAPVKPPVVLHKVRTTYKYTAEDEDELSFAAGEIIAVIEYDDPSEQEEGWLMGIKESDGSRGLFPANFTKELKP